MIAQLRFQDTCIFYHEPRTHTLTTSSQDRGVPAALDRLYDEVYRGQWRMSLPCVQLQVRILDTSYHGYCPA